MSDNLQRKWYGAALLWLTELEQNTELTRRTYETEFEGRHVSVIENVEQQTVEAKDE